MRSHLVLRRESRLEDEALGEATIESKTTVKKRRLELELRSRTSLGVLSHEAQAKMHMLGTALEVTMFKQRDGASVVLSDRCRARLDEAQLRSELAAEVHFLSARSHADELRLTCRESENRSESRFP